MPGPAPFVVWLTLIQRYEVVLIIILILKVRKWEFGK